MMNEQIHNIYLHMSGKAEGIAEVAGVADFPVLFARAILEFNRKEWVGLNLDDVPEIYVGDTAFLHGAQWAEAKLKEKNT